MLGKLLKYEFKYTARIILLFYGMVAGVTVFSSIVLLLMGNTELSAPQAQFYSVIFISIILLYALTLIAVYLLTFIYLCARFYRTMYSAQGYLTHTLPVTPAQTLHSKIIASFVWMTGTALLLVVSLGVFACALTDGEFFASILPAMLNEMKLILFISPAQLTGYWLVALLLGSLLPLLMVFTSMSIGQLSTRHKIGASIAAGIIIHYAQQIISATIGFIYMFWGMQSNVFTASTVEAEDAFSDIFLPMMNISLVYTALLIAGFYAACRIIVNKRINLE